MKRARARSGGTSAAPAPAPPAPPAPPEPPAPAPPPPAWRDPWGWIAALSVLVMGLHVRGAALGEPLLDDLLHLRTQWVLGHLNWLDGDGVPYYWRPLGRQAYFGVLGPLLLSRPEWVAALQAVMLALFAWLLYRALRTVWPGSWAAAAASFAVLHESAGMLIAWASNFQDLGAMLFAALAVHEASRRRLGTSLAALVASLMCKEVGVVTALLLPWVPGGAPRPPRERIRWALAAAATVVAWGALYWIATHRVGVLMPRDAPGSEHTFAVPWLTRYAWVLSRSFADIFNLSSAPQWTTIGTLVFGAVGAFAILLCVTQASARRRLRTASPWALWGAAWFLGASATLPSIFPGWAPYRSLFACVGLGFTAAGVLGAAHPALLAGLVVARALLVFAAPGADRVITPMPAESDVVINFQTLSRMQLVLRATREPLQRRFPALPPNARVCRRYVPRLTDGAMKGDFSLQAWYRDTTLRWVSYSDFRADTTLAVATVVEYQPLMLPTTALVEPEAMRALIAATDCMEASALPQAVLQLDRAEALQTDPGARVFLGTVASKRAVCQAEMGQPDAAEREAARGLAIWPGNPDSRYVLAQVWADRGRFAEAEAQLDTLLSLDPNDADAQELLQRVRAGR